MRLSQWSDARHKSLFFESTLEKTGPTCGPAGLYKLLARRWPASDLHLRRSKSLGRRKRGHVRRAGAGGVSSELFENCVNRMSIRICCMGRAKNRAPLASRLTGGRFWLAATRSGARFFCGKAVLGGTWFRSVATRARSIITPRCGSFAFAFSAAPRGCGCSTPAPPQPWYE